MDQPALSPEEEQEQLLDVACKTAKQNAFHMKRALDKCNLHEALKYSAQMLGELRTSALSPQKYYELYIKIFDELHCLEQYFQEEVKRGTRVEEIYEIVQHAGNIVPRLYLLVTIGSVYISSKMAAAKEILRDLVEMCKGVQHPTRGLFLRNYLSQLAKNKLPDIGNEYEGDGGDVQDSVDFILQNFNEMVRLWVRMETKGIVREKDKRDKERKELRILVGFNLTRLSQLEGVDLPMYEQAVFKQILDIIINCKDQIAQQYLMECIIQVFPDEFHLATLQGYLDSCMLLHQSVDLRSIFTSLMDRLANYAASFIEGNKAKDTAIEKAIGDMVHLFTSAINKSVAERPKVVNAHAFVQTQLSLLNLVLKSYPNDFEAVNAVIASTKEYFEQNRDRKIEANAVKLLKKLLTTPIDHYQNVVVCLQLESHPQLLSLLQYKARREIALDIAAATVKHSHKLDTPEHVSQLFTLISPLVRDEDDQPGFDEIYVDQDDFAEEQVLVGRLVHLFHHEEPDVLFKMYSAAGKQFEAGGPQRMRFTLIPLIFGYLRLACRIYRCTEEGGTVTTAPQKAFRRVLGMLDVLRKQEEGPQRQQFAETLLKLYLQAGATADNCKLPDVTYDALVEALTLYEEEATQSKQELAVLTTIIATIQSLKNLDADNYENLSTKACQYSSRLLKKPDQCQAAYLCSHLFWSGCKMDGHRVLECLQRSLKIVDGVQGMQIQLFVQILNHYLYYFNAKNDKVTVKYLNVLMELINTNINKSPDEETDGPSIQTFYQNTVRHIEMKQQAKDDDAERWAGIHVH